ncbi:MAG: hypothetical protein GY934_03950 [Gammaproteobacteria bacterium]|nr:hypothetical protein [Gammaproteobacteria bacterium]
MTSTIILPSSNNEHQQQQFDLPQPEPTPRRVYVVDGQVFTAPEGGVVYTIEQVRDQLAQTYPELSSATWSVDILPDGTEEVSFYKVTGEKGQVPLFTGEKGATDLDPNTRLIRQIVASLRQMPPANIKAIKLTRQLIQAEHSPQGIGIEQVMQFGPELQQALTQLDALESYHERSLDACKRLEPAPSPHVPLGF